MSSDSLDGPCTTSLLLGESKTTRRNCIALRCSKSKGEALFPPLGQNDCHAIPNSVAASSITPVNEHKGVTQNTSGNTMTAICLYIVNICVPYPKVIVQKSYIYNKIELSLSGLVQNKNSQMNGEFTAKFLMTLQTYEFVARPEEAAWA